MKNYFVCIISICVMVFLLWTPLMGGPKVVTFEKNLSIDPSRPVSLEFYDDDGSLRFSSWERDIIAIKVRKETKIRNAKRAERLLNATKIKISQKNNEIKIKIKYPKIKGIFFWIRDYRRIKVSTEIILPYRSNIKCILDDGSISGESILGLIFVETVKLARRHPVVALARDSDSGHVKTFEAPTGSGLARWVRNRW